MTDVPAPRPRPVAAPSTGRQPIIPPPIGVAEAPDGWGKAEFLTEVGSPFGDGYSIAREEAALADMDDMDHPDKDPRWPRYAMLIHRKEVLERRRLEYRLEQGAEPAVPYVDANKMTSLGRLVNSSDDTMTLHTKEAFRLFMGRRRDPDGKYQPIVGTKRCAGDLKALWAQSANDNPYADWALLRAHQGLRQFTREMEQIGEQYVGQLRKMAEKGLTFTVLQSAYPQAVALTFKSPYGFLIAEFTVDYDYFIRVIKTAVRKGRLTDEEGYEVIRNVTRKIRGWMEEIARFHRLLWRPELQKLSRMDFLPTAAKIDEDAAKRVEAVMGIFGPVPADIFSGKILPPYSKRHTHITNEERALLARVGQELAAAEEQEAAAAPEASDNGLL